MKEVLLSTWQQAIRRSTWLMLIIDDMQSCDAAHSIGRLCTQVRQNTDEIKLETSWRLVGNGDLRQIHNFYIGVSLKEYLGNNFVILLPDDVLYSVGLTL